MVQIFPKYFHHHFHQKKNRQNYTLREQRRPKIDIFINYWWKYQIKKNRKLRRISIEIDENINSDRNINIDENVNIDRNINIDKNINILIKITVMIKSSNVLCVTQLPRPHPVLDLDILSLCYTVFSENLWMVRW